MSSEFYVECYLNESSGSNRIADLACERAEDAIVALARNLAGMHRPDDAGRIQFRLRAANWSDFAAVGTALKNNADSAGLSHSLDNS